MKKALINRYLKLRLENGRSAFLWGPRKTGKSTLLKQSYTDSVYIDLLKTDLVLKYIAQPFLFRDEMIALSPEKKSVPIIIDEIQKVPQLLDEIHWLIENENLVFIMSGSSPRKLKRGAANLLGGRAWRFELFPFVYAELENPEILTILNRGCIPNHYLSTHYRKSQQGYLEDYLKEEILNEGITRNFPAFTRFFDALRYSHGELLNYSKIATDCGIDSKTVKGYFEILVDTLLGRMLLPYSRSSGREVIRKAPKFYLFDVGIAAYITNRNLQLAAGPSFGKALEHYILMELSAYLSYHDFNYKIWFWRSKTGLEVDFVIGDAEIAIEVKGTKSVRGKDLRSIRTFYEDHEPRLSIVVCNESQSRQSGKILLLPWRNFLDQLWNNDLIN